MNRLLFAVALVLASALSAPASGVFELPDGLKRTLEYLRANPEQNRERLAGFEKLLGLLQNLRYPTGPAELDRSIGRAGFSQRQLDLIRAKGWKTVTLGEFLPSARAIREGKGGLSLGLSTHRYSAYVLLSALFGLEAWPEAYRTFGIDWEKNPNHTPLFMDKVAATGKTVYFFVPDGLFSHPDSYTTKEMNWILQNASRLTEVVFVFGAYDLVSDELEAARKTAGISKDDLRALIMRAFGFNGSQWEG